MTEKDLLRRVVSYARAHGWRVHHAHTVPVRRGKYLTPVVGDKGFVDLVLVRPPRVVFVELKAERGRLRAEQRAWREALEACDGVEYYLLAPADDATIQRILQ